jgi:hypothetical protein
MDKLLNAINPSEITLNLLLTLKIKVPFQSYSPMINRKESTTV